VVSPSSDFDWKDIECCSFATPNVKHTFSADHVPSRVNIFNGAYTKMRVEKYGEKSMDYYEQLKQGNSVEKLVSIARRRVKRNGEAISSTGAKAALISRLKSDDIQFVTTFHRELSAEYNTIVDLNLNKTCGDDNARRAILSSALGYDLTQDDYYCFGNAQSMSPSVMNFILALYQKRDHEIVRVYPEMNINQLTRAPYIYIPSKFFDASAMDRISSFNDDTGENLQVNFAEVEHVYIPVPCNHNKWEGLIVAVKSKKIYYICPEADRDNDYKRARVVEFSQLINNWICKSGYSDNPNFNAIVVDGPYERLQNDFDSGYYVLALFDFIYHNSCPYFQESDIVNYRRILAYSALLRQYALT
jgi:hypothetical protein